MGRSRLGPGAARYAVEAGSVTVVTPLAATFASPTRGNRRRRDNPAHARGLRLRRRVVGHDGLRGALVRQSDRKVIWPAARGILTGVAPESLSCPTPRATTRPSLRVPRPRRLSPPPAPATRPPSRATPRAL